MSIVSTVGSGSLDKELDLKSVAEDIDAYTVDHKRDDVSGLYLRFKEQGPVVTLFRSGKFNIHGANSVEQLFTVKDEFVQAIDSLGIEYPSVSFRIANIVYVFNYDRTLDLASVSLVLGFERTEYEPEQFPGVIYRPSDEEGVALIFSSGKIIITGIVKEEEANFLYQNLQDRLANP